MPTIFASDRGEAGPIPNSTVDPDTSVLPKKAVHTLLHTYCLNPQNVHFEGQHRDEHVYLFLRAHPVTQIPWIASTIVALILPTFFNFIVGGYLSVSQVIFLNLFWHSALLSYILVNLLNWQFNVGLITEHRVIDIDFHNILYKEINATVIENVEDVTEKTSGFFASFFRFGSVLVQTAGTVVNIEYENIPKPTEVVRIINRLMRKIGHERSRAHRPA